MKQTPDMGISELPCSTSQEGNSLYHTTDYQGHYQWQRPLSPALRSTRFTTKASHSFSEKENLEQFSKNWLYREIFTGGISQHHKSAQYHPETNGRMPDELHKCQWIKLIAHSIYQQSVFLHFSPFSLPCSYGKCPSVQTLILIKTSSFSILTYLLMSSPLQSHHLCSEFFKAVSNFILSCEVSEDFLFEKGCRKK